MGGGSLRAITYSVACAPCVSNRARPTHGDANALAPPTCAVHNLSMTTTQTATATEVNLFAILDAILADSENAKNNLVDLAAIESYAESAGVNITNAHAQRIQRAGLVWLDAVANGDGEYSMYRGEAIRALEADVE